MRSFPHGAMARWVWGWGVQGWNIRAFTGVGIRGEVFPAGSITSFSFPSLFLHRHAEDVGSLKGDVSHF